MRHAECPVLSIIRGPIRYKIRLFRQSVNVLFELSQRYALPHRDAVAHDVKIRPGKVDDLVACAILDVSITNVPLTRDRPIKDLHSGGNFVYLQRKLRTDFA